MAVLLIGTSSILGGVNFLVTIFKMRAPGMTMFRMPIMAWTVLVTSVLVVLATPVLASALIMLFIDRNYGGSFFDTALRRQRRPVAARVLVLLPPGRLHHDPAGDGHRREIMPVFAAQAALRLQGVRLRDGRDRRPRLLGLGPPHVHDGRGLPAVLQLHDLPDRPADRRQDVQLAGDAVPGPADRSRPRCCTRSASCRCSSSAGSTARSARPCRSTSPSTTRTGSWPTSTTCCSAAPSSASSPGSTTGSPRCPAGCSTRRLGKIQFVLMFIGFNMTFFPMHILGPRRHAPADRRLRVDLGLGAAEPARDDRRVHHRRVDAAVPVERVHLAPQRQARRRRPVGGQHARVGDQLAAAAVQLRPPAADPLRAPASSTPATRRRRGPPEGTSERLDRGRDGDPPRSRAQPGRRARHDRAGSATRSSG